MAKLALARELISYLREEKKLWLLPLVIVLLLVGVIVVATTSDAVAPLIYTIF